MSTQILNDICTGIMDGIIISNDSFTGPCIDHQINWEIGLKILMKWSTALKEFCHDSIMYSTFVIKEMLNGKKWVKTNLLKYHAVINMYLTLAIIMSVI